MDRPIRQRLASISNGFVSVAAGVASFLFTLSALLYLHTLSEQLAAAVVMGLFALVIVWLSSERPNRAQSRATHALIQRLLAAKAGDLDSPAPPAVRTSMPALAEAVDFLFEQVRSTLDDVHAMALYDPVTGLPNRLHFRREADRLLRGRTPDDRFALLFFDLDGFKEVNDSLGHAQGDRVLGMVADRLRSVVRSEAEGGRVDSLVLARLAGDEFTIMLAGLKDARDAERIAQRSLVALGEPFEAGGRRLYLGASIGIAMSPDHATELTDLMKAADIAMYRAKAHGRSQICLYSSDLASEFERRVQTEHALRNALDRSEFELFYQPLLCARTGRVVAAEALIRWNHPEDGLRGPISFIGAAEQSSLIIEIGDWVIREAAAAAARWAAAGHWHRLTLNVSPRQLERVDFFDKFRAALRAAGAPLDRIEIEITETVAMQSAPTVIDQLATLRRDGVGIAIDDFGSGYSNLARLKELPIDRVKLDKSLVDDVDRSDGARTIVSAVTHLVHGLGCELVGEGVERTAQSEVLRAVGCDILQGFAYAEPMSEGRFLDWINEQEPAERLIA